MAKTIRIEDKLTSYLKLIKGIKSLGTHSDVIEYLAEKELMRTCAAISSDVFAEVGSVVATVDESTLVIDSICGSNVVFTDGTCLVNGGSVCRSLVLVAKSAGKYEGGFKNVR